MSYKSKSSFLSDNSANFSSGSVKWTGTSLQSQFANMPDSVMWIDQKVSMSTNNYDCSNGSLQEKTLVANVTMSISNATPGMYYTLIKKGSYSLAIPTGSYSSSGNVTDTQTNIVTFMYDGTNYYFNFSSYNLI
jgi:hypothetical protein